MPKSLFVKSDYEEILNRINSLHADSKNQWGKMTVNEMVCHLSDPLRDVLKIRKSKVVVPWFIRPLAKMMLITEKPFKPNTSTLNKYKQ